MEIIYENNNIILKFCQNFDLEQTFDCGQCFRFEKDNDGFFRGIANNRQLVLRQDGDTVTFFDITKEEFNEKWKSYFDLDRDYAKILNELSFDCHVKKACEETSGIRILRQDSWEILCSFIISQNNNIPRIKKIIASLCSLLGEPIIGNIYSFPSAEKVFKAGIEGLEPIKSGFRAKYIFDAAEKVANKIIDLEKIQSLNYSEAKKSLMNIKGVGEKVADCVLLFGFGFHEAFPRDVWVNRVIEKHYGKDFSSDCFGKNAGIAQQYLFYYERNTTSLKKQ
ncbi:MAG: hypothetical protein A2Y15_01465 [Clostridiales bacterium GWF2_36_10]|nr:MAG: hypothetical protein A2Y15_01465 [Clostridiales bacterium GWF2_36_10]HAN22115.1 hypothetical protein [Clostridiales bacterium]